MQTQARRMPFIPCRAFLGGARVVGLDCEVAMAGSVSAFGGNIPAHYDNELGPNIFEGYAADIAARANALAPQRTLELAAGTGIVSRKLRDALSGELVVTDLNAPMLEVARRKFGRDENVRFEIANAMALPFEDASFDLIVCQFGVMFFPEKAASFREALRVLKPGGRYLFNCWGTHAQNLFARLAHQTVIEFFQVDPPGFYRAPFSYADPKVALEDLAAAGFGDVSHEVLPLQKHIADVGAFAHGLIHGNPLIDEITQRGGVDPDAIVARLRARLDTELGPRATMRLLATVYSAMR